MTRGLLVAVLLALAAAGPAQAAPAGVVVQRDPVRISFLDASGHTVLRQAQPAGGFGIVPPLPEQQYGTPPKKVPASFAFGPGE